MDKHPASAEESALYYEDKDEALSQWLYELVALRKFRNDVWFKVEEQVKIRDKIYDLNQEPKEEEIPNIDYYKRLVRLEKEKKIMTDREKVSKVLEIIHTSGIKNERMGTDEVYESMREASLIELAEELTRCVNMVHGIRKILEGEE